MGRPPAGLERGQQVLGAALLDDELGEPDRSARVVVDVHVLDVDADLAGVAEEARELAGVVRDGDEDRSCRPGRAAVWMAILWAAGSVAFGYADHPPIKGGEHPTWNPTLFALEHIRDYLMAGTEQAWLIFCDPLFEVQVYLRDQPNLVRAYRGDDLIDAGPTLPDFKITAAQVFQL